MSMKEEANEEGWQEREERRYKKGDHLHNNTSYEGRERQRALPTVIS
jgi:hypothetical protein